MSDFALQAVVLVALWPHPLAIVNGHAALGIAILIAVFVLPDFALIRRRRASSATL